MRYLLSSLISILLISCATYPEKERLSKRNSGPISISNPYFANSNIDYVYKANIGAFGNAFGGIFIVKKLDKNHHRIVFTTELGNKIFDFTFLENEFKVNYILKEMDRKMLINILKKDFKVLIDEQISINEFFFYESLGKHFVYKGVGKDKKYFYSVDKESELLSKITRTRNRKEKVEFIFSEINNNIAKQVQILHTNFDLNIVLKAL